MSESLRIAVTGGSGRVGQWVVTCLLDRGHQVVNLDRTPGNDPRAKFVACDIRQRGEVEAVLRECDAVCHLAEIPSSSLPFSPDEIYWSNTRSAGVVLHVAADLKLRHAVYCSSVQIYGCWGENHVPPSALPIDENSPINPMNVYAASKAANEVLAQYLSRHEKLGISVVRFPGVLATPQQMETLWRYRDYSGRLSDGMCTYIHASDVATGLAAAIETARPGCEVYTLSADDILSVVPLRERLEKHHPDFPPLPAAWPDLKSPLLSEKAKKLLGWQPKWTFSNYLRERDSGEGRQLG